MSVNGSVSPVWSNQILNILRQYTEGAIFPHNVEKRAEFKAYFLFRIASLPIVQHFKENPFIM